MDRIDRQIVQCLQYDGRAPFRRIAQAAGVSEQTVARRYRNMLADGALRVLVLPDIGAPGEQTWLVRMRCRPGAADALADALAARDDVSWVTVMAGGAELGCMTRSSPEAPHRSVLLDRLPRTQQVLSFGASAMLRMHVGGDAEWLAFDDPLTADQLARLRPPEPVLDRQSARGGARPEDATLIAALARDGRAGVVELARATGWPPSRVSSRLDELLASGVHVEIDLAPEQFGFHTTATLWLTVAPGELESVGQALSLHRETGFVAAVTGAANLMASVTCRDNDELYTYVTTKVGALPAVRQAEVVPVLRRVKQAGSLVRGGRLQCARATRTAAGG